MSEVRITANVDMYLAVNKYEPDEGNPHIELVDEVDELEFDKLVRVCPAALYKRRENGQKSFDFSGCLECGTCRIMCGDTALKYWRNPGAGMGVEYRFG